MNTIFMEPPENFHPELEVASCYVMHGENILYLKRCATSTWSGTWGLPAGRIEEEQSPLDAMLREVREETQIDLSHEKTVLLAKLYVRDPQKDFVYYIFHCELASPPEKISLAADEHTEYRWMTPEEALQETLVPGEEECIELVFAKKQKINGIE